MFVSTSTDHTCINPVIFNKRVDNLSNDYDFFRIAREYHRLLGTTYYPHQDPFIIIIKQQLLNKNKDHSFPAFAVESQISDAALDVISDGYSRKVK